MKKSAFVKIFGVTVFLGVLVLFLLKNSYGLTNVSVPNTFSSGDTIFASDFNENFDTIYNAYNRLNDSVANKFLRSSAFDDTTWSRLRVDSIRSNPDVDSMHGNIWIDSIKGMNCIRGNPDVDSLSGNPFVDTITTRWLNVDFISSASGAADIETLSVYCSRTKYNYDTIFQSDTARIAVLFDSSALLSQGTQIINTVAFASETVDTIYWSKTQYPSFTMIELSFGYVTGTSDTDVFMTDSVLPTALRPTLSAIEYPIVAVDAGTACAAQCKIGTDGTIGFFKYTTEIYTTWTASDTKRYYPFTVRYRQ